MFSPDYYIDTVQQTKRVFTNQFIKDPTLNTAAHNYIEAQTAFAKMLTKNALDITQYAVKFTADKFYPSYSTTAKEEKAEVKARKTSKAKAEATTDINTQGE